MQLILPLLLLVGFALSAALAAALITLSLLRLLQPRTRLGRSPCYITSLLITIASGIWFIASIPFFRFSPGAPLMTVLFWVGFGFLTCGTTIGLLVAVWLERKATAP